MEDRILVGSEREISSISRDKWEALLKEVPKRMAVRLSFMTPEHRRIRYFVVREIARLCRPISPPEIAKRLRISQTRVAHILDELETRLFFLVRNEDGNVSWAFPVTADRTRHRLVFDTGERVYAA